MKNKKWVKIFGIGAMVMTLLFGGYASIAAAKEKNNTSAKTSAYYQGLVDNHSFEVKIKEQYYTIQLLDSNKHLVKNLNKNDYISFTYWVNKNKQLVLGSKLSKMEKKKETKKSTSEKTTGIYQGMIDNHSFEMKIGKEYKVVQVLSSNKHLLNNIKTGDKIEITYWVNVKNQNILGSKVIKR